MSGYTGNLRDIESPANYVGAAIITTAGAVVAQNWPDVSGTYGSTAQKFVIFDGSVMLAINMFSTGAAFPTTNSSGTTASSGLSFVQPAGHQHTYRIPSASTGYSITA